MKPSVLAVSFFSSPGAVADNFHTLARSLARQTELTVLTSSLIADRPIPGVGGACYLDFAKQRPLKWLHPGQWLDVLRLGRRRHYDLLFLYSEHPLHVAVQLISNARRTLFWCLDPAPHSGSIGRTAMVYEAAKRALMHRADRIVVACDALRRDVVTRYDVPDRSVIASFHGVLENLVFPDIDSTAPRDIDVLFFGRLEAYKGVDVLLEAVSILRSQAYAREPRVVIAGPGSLRIPPTDGVTVEARFVPDRELATMVARARIVVMPYRDATGSQVPQTAFVYGTPVIATAVGCLPEYVTDGMNGLVVPPNDPRALAASLDRLLEDPTLWATLSAGARKTARETFSNEVLTARLLAQSLA